MRGGFSPLALAPTFTLIRCVHVDVYTQMYASRTKGAGFTFGIRHSEYAVQMVNKEAAVDE